MIVGEPAMRLFYASFLAAENMRSYEALVEGVLADVPTALRSVPTSSHHLTLAFVGNIDEPQLPDYLDVLESASPVQAFQFSLHPPRILYSRRRPRLVCADLSDGGARVQELQTLLLRELHRYFPSSQIRPKPPHVTLARFSKRANRQTARRVAESLSRREATGPARTDRMASVHLVRSTLTPSGPVYESLGETVLSGGVVKRSD